MVEHYYTTILSQNAVVTQTIFAGLDALGPCMTKLRVASLSTVLEPSTTTSTTALSTRFLDVTAFWAYETAHRWRRHGKPRRHRA